MQRSSKTSRPIKGDGEWRKHRDPQQSRYFWKRERTAAKRQIEETREES